MPPPFDPAAARRLRWQLGMSHAQVSHAIRVSFALDVAPGTVRAWERGEAFPGEREVAALAGALWCAPADLLGRPTTLREHRWAAGLALEDLALAVGLRPREYRRMEEHDRWTGDDRRTAALGEVLRLTPRELLALTGRDAALAALLRSAATVRWQAYVRPVAALVPYPRQRVAGALRRMYDEYQALMTATLSWSASAPAGNGGGAYLDAAPDRFWALVAPGH
ncbi:MULTISPECIES: helix-turn-helix domain-containing protein [Streptomycetaceae]|nr:MULTISPECIES: helix-turn-helix transcriptional regulator [Streptomycetaceae]MYS61105.1 XRE family transcriptional regulator [Streptomyces sp. SID5468]CCB76947.1 conserved protein of unknown function [Streptantibioticus cattleyicolor NRRL 8057 = DSM 46488]